MMRWGFLNCAGTLKLGPDLAGASFFDSGVDVADGLAFLPDTFGVSARGDVLRRDGEGSMTTVLLTSLGASGSGGRVTAFPAATRDQWPAGGVGIPALSHRSFSRWLTTPYSRARWLMGDDHTFSYSRSRSIRVTGASSATIPSLPFEVRCHTVLRLGNQRCLNTGPTRQSLQCQRDQAVREQAQLALASHIIRPVS